MSDRVGAAIKPGVGGYVVRGVFLAWLGVLVVLPLGALVARGLSAGAGPFVHALTSAGARDALWLSLWTSLACAVVQAVMGTAIAWVLVRFDVPGRSALSALVDLPLALPTLVAGVLLVALLGPQTPVGGALGSAGLRVAFATPGIVLALLFVTLPFVVRAVEPVLRELDPAEEEAAVMLGASRPTVFARVLLPPLLPAIAAGTAETFARAVAEFGSIAAVSGNIPHKTLTAPVWILGEVEAGHPETAAAMSIVLLAVALAVKGVVSVLKRAAGGRRG